ncbi:MAG: hypothetical protein RSA27_03625, partial [Oscillospiraceae bacterium]
MKHIMISLSIIICAFFTPFISYANTEVTRDFTFGLQNEFKGVKSVRDDDDGHDTFDRFLQVRSELPNEVPLFEPYEANGEI